MRPPPSAPPATPAPDPDGKPPGGEVRDGAARTTPTPAGLLLAALAFLAVALLLWSSRELLSPPILFAFVWIALHPFRRVEGYTPLLVALALITALWVLATSGGLLAPFLVALGLAYLLDPVVDALEERGIGRSTAILLLTVPVLAGVVLLLVFALPAAGRQTAELIDNLPTLIDRVTRFVESLPARLANLPWLEEYLVDRLAELDAESLVAMLEARHEELARRSWQAVLGVGQGIGTLLTLAGYLILTPVLTFYLLRDWDGLVRRVGELIPRSRHDSVVDFAVECDHLLGRYLRGQITVALIIGVLFGLGFALAGIPYAILLGALAAVVGIVPYLGPILTLIPALLVALLSGSVGAALLKVLVVFAVVQTLDGNVISPRIVGRSVGLHPVWVVLALTAGGYYLGFVGLLLGIPIAVVVKLLIERAVERYRASRVFRSDPG